jgi:hypothetical protein
VGAGVERDLGSAPVGGPRERVPARERGGEGKKG